MARKDRLNIWMNGVLVGQWIIRQGQSILQYDPQWMKADVGRPLSLSLPFTQRGEHRGMVVGRYFDNLLPDSVQIRQRIATHYGLNDLSAFNLLAEIGRDCVGAIQLLAEDVHPQDELAPE